MDSLLSLQECTKVSTAANPKLRLLCVAFSHVLLLFPTITKCLFEV
jgi:hypothetical protein